jgi:hypothetical protein
MTLRPIPLGFPYKRKILFSFLSVEVEENRSRRLDISVQKACSAGIF